MFPIDHIRKISSVLFIIFASSCNSQKNPTPEQKQVLETAKANFVFVEGGTFIMGNNDYHYTTLEHQVALDSYSISKYETTFKEFDLYTELNNLGLVYPNYRNQEDMGPDYGAIGMNWFQAQSYCQWLGEQLNLPIDLPTEAQWEYAARSRGLNVEHATDSGKIEGSFTEKRNYPAYDTIVGAYPPNPLGVYDMSGGRPEWTNDWLVGYSKDTLVNPRYDTIHNYEEKMVRGWHKLRYSVYSRGGSREPDNDGSGVGFRCVCNQKNPIE
ncbi:formylglycine-generating enzyme family protein [Cellulophaga baltica]|uniref:formylglycine-generating enzyme family protein n=1 Tax=Cellulophaga baltica TaxID=76594 RepID=UPI0015F62B03|nr:SUMF1/EgtB/PvdO family nonheme iron enzyme [Cellulophaga baltica]MBA6314771.1 formylglycine-generating enzyme family protein [Cellulophaga baltica]